MGQTKGLYFKLAQAIQNDELSLPTLPDVALKIRNEVSRADVTLDDIVNLVQLDVALNHYIISVANCPLFRGVNEIKELHDAISRLGFTATQNMVFSYSIKKLFRAKHSPAKDQLNWIWQKTKKIAAMSMALATDCRDVEADKALLAGLFVNIGTLAIVQYMSENDTLPDSEEELWNSVDQIADKAGTLILKHWNFDEDFCNVTRYRHHWDAEHNTLLSYVDIVLVAEALIEVPPHVEHPQDWFDHLSSRRKIALHGLALSHLEIPENVQRNFEINLQLLSL